MRLDDNVDLNDAVRFKSWASRIKSLFLNFSFAKELTATATLDFPSIATLTDEDLTITVTGAAANDSVVLGLPTSPTTGIVFNAFVSAADTVTVRAHNYTAGAIDPASATYRVTVFKY